jgi:hypothetical protein
MPTLAVGMLWDFSANLMPTTSVGMAPYPLNHHCRNTFFIFRQQKRIKAADYTLGKPPNEDESAQTTRSARMMIGRRGPCA